MTEQTHAEQERVVEIIENIFMLGRFLWEQNLVQKS